MARKEGPLVELLPPEPAGDFVVALAGVAGGAGRHDVFERVSSASGEREHAVALQRLVRRAAVRTPTPSSLKRCPRSSVRSCSTMAMRRLRRRAARALRSSGDRHPSSVCSARRGMLTRHRGRFGILSLGLVWGVVHQLDRLRLSRYVADIPMLTALYRRLIGNSVARSVRPAVAVGAAA